MITDCEAGWERHDDRQEKVTALNSYVTNMKQPLNHQLAEVAYGGSCPGCFTSRPIADGDRGGWEVNIAIEIRRDRRL